MKVLISIPTHSETLTTQTVSALLMLEKWSATSEHEFFYRFHSGAMIGELRNIMVAEFMDGPYDALLMWDSDQAMAPELIEQMLAFDNPVVGCLYPKRVLSWDRVENFAASKSIRDVLYCAQIFVGQVDYPAGPQVQFKVEDGFSEALYVGTGCLVIRRSCITTMIEHYPELKGRGFNAFDYPEAPDAWNFGFFNPGWSDMSNRLVAEDFAFCERWRATGGKIYANVSFNTVHVGRYLYGGNYIDHLRASLNAGIRPVGL